jgi:hypothetical protein
MRQLTLALLLVSLTVFGQCQFLETIGALLPELQQVFSMLKTETTTTIHDPVYPAGFTSLHTGIDHNQGAIKKENIPQLFDIWLTNVARTPESIQNIKNFIQLYMIQDVYDPLEKTVFQFSFDDGHGQLYFLRMVLAPHETIEDVVRWETLAWYSDFTPAKPFTIVTKSKCNILSCKSTDKIVYMEAVITQDHINTVANLGINFLHLFNDEGANVVNVQMPPTPDS